MTEGPMTIQDEVTGGIALDALWRRYDRNQPLAGNEIDRLDDILDAILLDPYSVIRHASGDGYVLCKQCHRDGQFLVGHTVQDGISRVTHTAECVYVKAVELHRSLIDNTPPRHHHDTIVSEPKRRQMDE